MSINIIISSYHHIILSSYHDIIISSYHHVIHRAKTVNPFWSKIKEKNFNRPSTPSPRNVETWTFGEMGSFFEENLLVTLKKSQLFQNEEIMLKILPRTPKIFEKILSKKISDVEKWNVGNRLKRVLAKFEADRSHPRGVNGRSKFCKKVSVVPVVIET